MRPTHFVWYLATCQDCTLSLPQPFKTEVERNEWAAAHAGATGHEVRYHEMARWPQE